MEWQSRKWMILVATIWIQAFTGTNFDFSAYSTEMKAVLGISQVQLNYLATASDLGKAVGWSSGLALMWLPLWAVLFAAAVMGLVGYGAQWLVLTNVVALPYFVICAVYLLLNALIPFFTSTVALIPILGQLPDEPHPSDLMKRDQLTFLKLNLLAIATGLYLLLLHPLCPSTACILFSGSVLLLMLPLAVPGVIYARDWFERTVCYSSFRLNGSGFILVHADDLEVHKELLGRADRVADGVTDSNDLVGKDRPVVLGQEHNAGMLARRLDFWLYYGAYFCGGTIGLAYSNNIGQIAQSLGHSLMNSKLITIYSSFSFFGRLLSAAPDFLRTKFYFARTGWIATALLPTPIAFFFLSSFGGDSWAVQTGTALIGLSSGFIFAAAVTLTSELFGPESVGVNHNILITNIPIGSLVYGFLAATVYDTNASSRVGLIMTDSFVCMGRECYFMTFVWWGCISLLGLGFSVLLFLRTRPAYDRFERSRRSTVLCA
ncbi:hypothetical protein OROGR_012893 [Orobanche gracilis]